MDPNWDVLNIGAVSCKEKCVVTSFWVFLKWEEDMENDKNTNNNFKRNRTKINKSFFNIKEKAAFEMLQQRKLRQISNKDMH